MGTEWTNSDGLIVHFGTRDAEDLRGGVTNTAGKVKELVIVFNYDDLPDGSTDGSYTSIPAGAIPLEAIIDASTAFVDGTSYDIDFVDSAGTAIGSGEDKLWDALTLAQANAGDVCSAHAGTNSANALNVALASAGFVKVAATGTFTAGQAKLTIRYVDGA